MTPSDTQFFCMYYLRMAPDQVAFMWHPEATPAARINRKGLALILADRWAYAVAYAAVRGCFRH